MQGKIADPLAPLLQRAMLTRLATVQVREQVMSLIRSTTAATRSINAMVQLRQLFPVGEHVW